VRVVQLAAAIVCAAGLVHANGAVRQASSVLYYALRACDPSAASHILEYSLLSGALKSVRSCGAKCCMTTAS
jgi:hypothetical protein